MKKKKVIEIVDAPIIRLTELTEKVYEIFVKAPAIAEKAKPGQFVSIHLGKNHQIRRPFSIAGTNKGELRLVIKKTGRVTDALSRFLPGETISVMGPLGNSFECGDYKKIICVAGGAGIAPLLFLLQKEIKNRNFYLIFGVKTVKEAWYEEMFNSLKGFLLTTEDGSSHYAGRSTDYLLSTDQFFRAELMIAAGPLQMLKSYVSAFRFTEARGIVSLEAYMGCSLGACNSCVVKTSSGWKKVCQDGPVFDGKEIEFSSLEVPVES